MFESKKDSQEEMGEMRQPTLGDFLEKAARFPQDAFTLIEPVKVEIISDDVIIFALGYQRGDGSGRPRLFALGIEANPARARYAEKPGLYWRFGDTNDHWENATFFSDHWQTKWIDEHSWEVIKGMLAAFAAVIHDLIPIPAEHAG